MENTFITEKLRVKFGEDILDVDDSLDILTVTVASPVSYDVIAYLKNNPSLGFRFLTDLTGIHYPDRGLAFGVVYHLHNFYENKRLRIKTFVSGDMPAVRTVSDIFSAANWMERETFDFYGIVFEGHPNLKRILNVEYLDYFPMRKEYPLEDPTREDKDNRFFGRE
ncbi:MAG: NADH-quinone oxidoreductase subunit C [Bacteroidota bacterium]